MDGAASGCLRRLLPHSIFHVEFSDHTLPVRRTPHARVQASASEQREPLSLGIAQPALVGLQFAEENMAVGVRQRQVRPAWIRATGGIWAT